jgi:molecular chaperone HtpG
MLGFLHDFEGKPLESIAKGDLDLGELADAAEKEEQARVADEYKELVGKVKTALGERVKDVRVTRRLTDSPACVVADRDAMSGHLARLLKAAGQKAPAAVPVLEINPGHALIRRIEREPDERIVDWAQLVFDEALLAEGGELPDPAAFVRRLNALMFAPAAAGEGGPA